MTHPTADDLTEQREGRERRLSHNPDLYSMSLKSHNMEEEGFWCRIPSPQNLVFFAAARLFVHTSKAGGFHWHVERSSMHPALSLEEKLVDISSPLSGKVFSSFSPVGSRFCFLPGRPFSSLNYILVWQCGSMPHNGSCSYCRGTMHYGI